MWSLRLHVMCERASRQCTARTQSSLLNAGLVDEIHVDVVALLLGSGVRLFDRLAGTPTVLGSPAVVQGVGVTHMRYSVRKA